tara:strand:- start:771 stop:944 length:174 start_codon:yes stop_codon:yes gene_type:complete
VQAFCVHLALQIYGTKIYQSLPKDCQKSLKETVPLAKPVKKIENYSDQYKTWKKTKK